MVFILSSFVTIVHFTLTLTIPFSVVVCIESGSLAKQNLQENFRRAFQSQLVLIENQSVGCLFDHDLCTPEDTCYDDGLFGTCIASYADETVFTYRLPPQLLRDLKAILASLVAQNYTWHDRFTQCSVRAALICGSMEIATDLSVCEAFAEDKEANSRPVTSARTRNAVAKRFDEIWDEFTKRLDPWKLGKLRQLAGDIKEKRLQQLLARHKYEYALDIPEKKLEQHLNRHIFSDALKMQDAKLKPHFSEADRDDEEASDFPAWKLRLFTEMSELRRVPNEQDSTENLAEESDGAGSRDDNRVDATESDRGPPARIASPRTGGSHVPPPGPPAAPRKAGPRVSLAGTPSQGGKKFRAAAQLKKRQLGDDPASFVDGGYLWMRLKNSSSLKNATILGFVARVNQLVDKRLLEDQFRVYPSSNEVYFQLSPLAQPADVQRLLSNETTASKLMAGGKFEWAIYGFGRPQNRVEASELSAGSSWSRGSGQVVTTMIVCGVVLSMVAALFVLFAVQRFRSSKQRLRDMAATPAAGGSADYGDLCRQRMLGKSSEQAEPVSAAAQQLASARPGTASDSPNSSTGSWSDDPIQTDMDITTGHLILSYMEEYLSSKEKLEQEWANLCSYEADQTSAAAASAAENAAKNRYPDLLPYDHSRVVLRKEQNSSSCDYINASFISDSDPKVKSYILTQGPTDGTAADFWQMLWECDSVTVVNLTKLRSADGTEELCAQYWPSEGSRLFNRFEVHLVSEHIWCGSFVVRNFYLKNLANGEARTVTMFHFLSWDENGLPTAKALLDFRRKVNKSYKGRASPLVIHCNDGCGRTGAFCLLDLALSRISKGVKEIDLAACLEHLRDQRPGLVRSKDQFEFVVAAIAEEVHNVLRTLPQ